MGFPLPRGYFKGVDVSGVQRQELNDLVHHRVKTLLKDEQRYRERIARYQPVVHPGEWMSTSRSSEHKDLQLYRRRRRGRSLRELAMEEDFREARRAVESGHPSMVAIGYVDGSIEDMMYGMSATSQADLMTGFSYKNPPRDCAVLGHLGHATPEDPFRSADFIWVLPKLPPAAKQVDVCYLKATGVESDAIGNRYGYLVLHSVDLSECPPFDKRYKVTRAKMYFACLFREIDGGSLQVIVRGIFDLAGTIKVDFMLKHATASFITGLLNGVGIGESKKLTLLACRNQSARRDLAQAPTPTQCSMCSKRGHTNKLVAKTVLWYVVLDQCRVCGDTICSKCAEDVKTHSSMKRFFLGAKRACKEYTCCPSCVRDAKNMSGVRPADPEFEVVADYYRIRRSQSQSQLQSSHSSTSSNGSASDAPPPMFSLDSVTQNRPMISNKSQGMWTNSTVDESVEDDYRFSDASELNSADYNFDSGEEANGFAVMELDYQSVPSTQRLPGPDADEVVPWEERSQINVQDDFTNFSRSARPQVGQIGQPEGLLERLQQMNILAEDTKARMDEIIKP
ncbi:hypothetical protein PHYBOEH_005207 [Phytophthora boehmeriae]|uniref:FYVE-type domain-containing protein n=1 Tax=Phytophthora boehmeriae TaxID=109152 RepID=A0A8T1WKK1_9STRA|nr:hypothetical protein PHYBOEH_005207 [Phytophthora boehmeriae]